MKSNQLRIGNYIEYAGVICEVEEIHKKTITTNGVNAPISSLLSIPLTEEWLLKFGFEKKPMYGKYNKYFFIKNKLYYCEHDFYCFVYSNNQLEIKEPKHVHSLQNLHFALTGEELTINNK